MRLGLERNRTGNAAMAARRVQPSAAFSAGRRAIDEQLGVVE